ncbi:MAG: hypothetical protein R3D32_07150 [Nitratireductor sp.]
MRTAQRKSGAFLHGIGLAAAKRFIAEGWRIAIVDIDAPELEVAAPPCGAMILHGDVSSVLVAGVHGRD